MADAVLFTQSDPRRGPAATSLFQVKGMTEIVLTVERVGATDTQRKN